VSPVPSSVVVPAILSLTWPIAIADAVHQVRQVNEVFGDDVRHAPSL